MSAPNIQVRNDPQVVTGGTAGTKLIGPTTVEGDLTVTGSIIGGGGGGGLSIVAAGTITLDDSTGITTVLSASVAANSIIMLTSVSAGNANILASTIVPGVSFTIGSDLGAPASANWIIVNP
jgi:hypothetical protein